MPVFPYGRAVMLLPRNGGTFCVILSETYRNIWTFVAPGFFLCAKFLNPWSDSARRLLRATPVPTPFALFAFGRAVPARLRRRRQSVFN
jgi:hypothetical protein